MKYEKYKKDGKVAVIVSYGYGAGWYTWNELPESEAMLFDKRIVEKILNKEEINKEEMIKLGYSTGNYYGGSDGLSVEWVKEGSLFKINEYGGYESLELITNKSFLKA